MSGDEDSVEPTKKPDSAPQVEFLSIPTIIITPPDDASAYDSGSAPQVVIPTIVITPPDDASAYNSGSAPQVVIPTIVITPPDDSVEDNALPTKKPDSASHEQVAIPPIILTPLDDASFDHLQLTMPGGVSFRIKSFFNTIAIILPFV